MGGGGDPPRLETRQRGATDCGLTVTPMMVVVVVVELEEEGALGDRDRLDGGVSCAFSTRRDFRRVPRRSSSSATRRRESGSPRATRLRLACPRRAGGGGFASGARYPQHTPSWSLSHSSLLVRDSCLPCWQRARTHARTQDGQVCFEGGAKAAKARRVDSAAFPAVVFPSASV